MEHFQRNNANAFTASRGSSVYSIDTEKHTSSSDYAESRTSTSSRPISIVPSYMNATVPIRKPVKSRPIGTSNDPNYENGTAEARTPAKVAKVERGTLILAVAALPHPRTVEYLDMLLKRGSYDRLVIVGHADYEGKLKELKMGVYALLGTLGLEVGVQMETARTWDFTTISEKVERALVRENTLHGVLCSPALKVEDGGGADILSSSEAAFEEHWRGSVSFLRSWAKATVPCIKPNPTSRAASGVFLVTESPELSPVSSIYKAASDRIVVMLADSNLRLTIAYADTVLIPEPEPVMNGKLDLNAYAGNLDEYDRSLPLGESPTKLWNMWAQMDEMSIT